MARSDFRKGGAPYTFAAMPMAVLRSAELQALPHSASRLMLDLMAQYTGKNNGRLTPTWEAMERAGWASRETLARAKRALIEAPFVVVTRKGHPPRTTEWIGFTWWKLDYDASMDVDAKAFPYLNFLSVEASRIDPNVGRGPIPKTLSVSRKPYSSTPKTAPGLTKTVSMEASE